MPKRRAETLEKLLKETRIHVSCNCVRCKGKLVDPRTKKKHEQRQQPSTLVIEQRQQPSTSVIGNVFEKEKLEKSHVSKILQEHYDPINILPGMTNRDDDIDDNNNELSFVPKKKPHRHKFVQPELFVQNDIELTNQDQSDSKESYEELEEFFDTDTESDNDYEETNINNSFNFFAPPDYKQGNSESIYNTTDCNSSHSWILIWIFKFQSHFRLPDTAINILIKFI